MIRPISASPTASATRARHRALAGIAISQLLVLTLWFSASAVGPQLAVAWRLDGGAVAGLTLMVQVGFVVGAVGSSVVGLADLVPARRLFLVAGVLGAGANAALLLVGPDTLLVAFLLRFTTGVALAGVYPSGLKVMAGWFRRGRGMALGVLVGALTVGSAGPHLIRGAGVEWRGVILGASLLALVGAVLLGFGVKDGPHETATARFAWSHLGTVVRNRGVRLSTYGYLGHMWELYAMWTWTAAFLAASAASGGHGTGWVSSATFAIIAIGGPASWLAGVAADRWGRTLVAGAAMAVSGGVALATPLLFGAHPVLVVGVFLVWGFAVVADSAQFSTMVTETTDGPHRGTALTLQTGIGFLLTLVTIRGVPLIADSLGWRWAFPWLAVGPALGIVAMVALRRAPEAVRLAEGRG